MWWFKFFLQTRQEKLITKNGQFTNYLYVYKNEIVFVWVRKAHTEINWLALNFVHNCVGEGRWFSVSFATINQVVSFILVKN